MQQQQQEEETAGSASLHAVSPMPPASVDIFVILQYAAGGRRRQTGFSIELLCPLIAAAAILCLSVELLFRWGSGDKCLLCPQNRACL